MDSVKGRDDRTPGRRDSHRIRGQRVLPCMKNDYNVADFFFLAGNEGKAVISSPIIFQYPTIKCTAICPVLHLTMF